MDMSRLNFKYLFQGTSATLSRETPGFAVYFISYNAMKNQITRDDPLYKLKCFMFGGFAGCCAWSIVYPQDRIKTRMQTSQIPLTYMQTLKQILAQDKIGGLYKGFHYALMRAVPLHAAAFAMMEFLNNIDLFKGSNTYNRKLSISN